MCLRGAVFPGRGRKGRRTFTSHPLTASDDACASAKKAFKPPPARPASLPAAAVALFESLQSSSNAPFGSEFRALDHRNKLFAMQRMFGSFQLWNTTTPDDLASQEIYSIANPSGAASDFLQDRASRVAGDAPACAMHHMRVQAFVAKHMFGWDKSRRAAADGGGFFGKPKCYAGPTEEQKRLSLHFHWLACLDECLPRTSRQLLSWLSSADFIAHFKEYVAATTAEGHPVTVEEYTTPEFTAHQHAVFADMDCDAFRALRSDPAARGVSSDAVDFPGGPRAGGENTRRLQYDGVPKQWAKIKARKVNLGPPRI